MLDIGDFAVADAREVGAFAPPKADDAVGLLDGALLVGGVGVGVVDGNTQDLLKLTLVEKLFAIVGGYAL